MVLIPGAGGQGSGGPFGDICAFDGWPHIPVHAIAGGDDRFFPVELQQPIARGRLGIEPEVVPGGHLAALSHPEELSAALARYLSGPPGPAGGAVTGS